jgi:hypothetical protein
VDITEASTTARYYGTIKLSLTSAATTLSAPMSEQATQATLFFISFYQMLPFLPPLGPPSIMKTRKYFFVLFFYFFYFFTKMYFPVFLMLLNPHILFLLSAWVQILVSMLGDLFLPSNSFRHKACFMLT